LSAGLISHDQSSSLVFRFCVAIDHNKKTVSLAFKRSGDPNMGNFNDATILKSFGEVPANLDEL
jgi:hypothetical protein